MSKFDVARRRDEDMIRDFLRGIQTAAGKPRGDFVYSCAADFLLQHGKSYKAATTNRLPPGINPGKPKACFGNAMGLVLRFPGEYRYVEGYALTVHRVLPVHHAWVVSTRTGRILDNTWINILFGVAYIGVEFSIGRADDAGIRGDATVLDDWKRGWPLFRQKWTGEDWDREWELSPETQAILAVARQMGVDV